MKARVAVVQATPVVLDGPGVGAQGLPADRGGGRGGSPPGRAARDHLSGGSLICDPLGNVLAGPAHGGEEILYADCDLDLLLEARRVLDTADHYDRADLTTG